MNTLLLVHIAKAAGTSLRRLLKLNSGESGFDCFHNGFLLRFENGCRVSRNRVELNSLEQYEIAIFGLRHPLARLQSCYRYFISGGLNGRGNGEFPADRKSQEFLRSVAPTFSSCCQNLSVISGQIPHFRSASFWLDSLERPLAKNIICCRQESFDDDVDGLLGALRLPPSTCIEHSNESVGFLPDLYNISEKDVRCIEQFYSADYLRFGYEFSSYDSLSLVQYWDQPSPPGPVIDRMNVCKSLNPAWVYRRFNRQSASDFLASAYGSDIASAFLDIRLPAMQADVFRVAFLLHEGGLWVDAATSLIRPIDSWLDRRHSLQMLRRSHQVHPKIATQIIFAGRPGLPLLQAGWGQIVPRLLSRSGTKVYRHFGPGVFRDLMSSRPNLAFGLHAVTEASLESYLKLGSSSKILPSDQHWTKRQEAESLYLSGGWPSASQARNDAS